MQLRKANFEDLQLLGSIRKEAIIAQPETFWNKDEKSIAANFWDKMDIHEKFSDYEIYIVENNKLAQAFVGWKGDYLAFLFILPQYQGSGLGKKLLEFAEENIRKNHNSVWLYSHPYAEKFYMQHGFIKCSETEDPFGIGELYKFQKSLGSVVTRY